METRSPDDPTPKKIVILGGGAAALATAFRLTSAPDWQKRYQVDLYQMGWRLGGKGASGRNPAVHQRIEEHGLHVWPGFYHNAFHIMQVCYREMGRIPGQQPIATWEEAFHEHDFIVDEEWLGSQWVPWSLLAPHNASIPGVGGPLPTFWDYVSMALQLIVSFFRNRPGNKATGHDVDGPLAWVRRAFGKVLQLLEAGVLFAETLFLRCLAWLWQCLSKDVRRHHPGYHRAMLGLLGAFMRRLQRKLAARLQHEEAARHFWILLDLAHAGIRGMLEDRLFESGLDPIDDQDFRAWLRKHGAAPMTVDSALIRGLYDFIFAYDGGDSSRPSLAAGVGLRLCLRTAFAYKGAMMWKMQAGMGDIVFVPLYEALRQRGVRFHFFHRVKNLGLSSDKGQIEGIVLGRQATLKNAEYQPFVDVNGLPCWPNAPCYDQLVEGTALREQNVNLESTWSSWPDVEEVTLRRNEQFDVAVLGISLAGLPAVCSELIAANAAWRQMVEQVKTVQTLAVQLWLKPTLEQLGWSLPSPILAAFADPLETWADMSQTLPREAWPATQQPGNVSYFCGPLVDLPSIPPPSDTGFPERERQRAQQLACTWLQKEIASLWPKATTAANPRGLNWELLVAPDTATGAARFDHQLCKANVEPSDRYVISATGSTRFRLPAHESGFANLYLAGDWVRNGMNFGCVESAVVSGLQAARAIDGGSDPIIGETDW
jgi:uncharacterized protein with NAD-binding domain and iron-sulfur cluster